MHQNTELLGLSAFVSYFGLDALTTCAGVCLYGIGAEANPAMSFALGSGGLAGFILLKLILSLCLVIPAYFFALHPGTKALGESALAAILAGGGLAAINNMQVLLTGTSPFFMALGRRTYLAPGVTIAIIMFFVGMATYITLTLKDRKLSVRTHF
ncbi:MAG TPA: DUF5658 family protein [Methanocella sp.]|uniref:DUF5658 family protein n=1 Tax=Methanocella sp. TaxID=2052833 RepID=UPI002B9F8A3A|nr:DUF5658 family protein [Methanocella sp.]HTY92138.1 DUF5658 family protein [Methanocella sp.]